MMKEEPALVSLIDLQLACGVCFWSVELESGSVWVGPGWEHLLGFPAKSASKTLTGWLDLFHPVDQAEVKSLLQMASGRPSTVLEVRLRHSDGNWRWVRLKGRSVGNPKSILGMAEEITQDKVLSIRAEERRRAAEEALRRSEELYRGLYEHTTEHLFSVTVDSEGTLRYEGLNPAHQNATGLREEDLRGKRPTECLPEAVAAHVEANYRRCLELKEPICYEEELDLPNGRISWLTQLVPLRNSTGEIVRLLGICTDLTKLKEKERTLRSIQRQESVGKVASGIAHDFNNLLTVIICQLGLMELEVANDQGLQEYVEQIGEAAQRASELTRGLLSFGVHSEESRSPQNIQKLVSKFQRILKSLVGPQVELVWLLEETASVLAYAIQIDQLLLNLVVNAGEALGAKGGVVTVRLSQQRLGNDSLLGLLPAQKLSEGEYVTLEVSDDGPGIPESIHSTIFESQFSTKSQGRGLGLPTVKSIVEDLGGAILLRSELSRGTSFKVFLPACQAVDSDHGSPEQESFAPLQGKALFSSSDLGLRRLLGEALTRLGLEREESAHPTELVSVLAVRPSAYEIVLLDVVSKSEQDLVMGALASLDLTIPILVLSDLPAGELLLNIDYKPPTGFLHKPFELKDLERALQRLLPPA